MTTKQQIIIVQAAVDLHSLEYCGGVVEILTNVDILQSEDTHKFGLMEPVKLNTILIINVVRKNGKEMK